MEHVVIPGGPLLNPHLRLDWLASFVAVVEYGGFGAAAEAGHRSQPRVSAHVASLERAVGLVLLDRRTRPVELTGAGRAMLAHAQGMLRAAATAENDMRTWHSGGRGVVHLGAHPSASAAFVPDVIKRAAGEAPDITVSLLERSTLELDEAVQAGEVDLYLRPMAPLPSGASLVTRPLWREDLVVVVPEGHPLAGDDGPVAVADAMAHPLISIGHLESPVPPSFEAYEFFRAQGYELEPVQATNLPQTLISMVSAGLGLGVTNRLAVQQCEHLGIRLRRLEGDGHRVVAACWLGESTLSPAARTILDLLVRSPVPAGTTSVEGR
jgi:DNA-binding transcriptional LysR family regulator